MGKTMSLFQIKSEKMVDCAITSLISFFFLNEKLWVGRATVSGEKRGWPLIKKKLAPPSQPIRSKTKTNHE